MYTPESFRVDDIGKLQSFMAENGFATLVTHHDGSPFASHIPVHIDPAVGPFGTLRTHVARANPQWQHIDEAEVLVVFHGAHAYISPRWYRSELMVPTWNYDAVHAYGRARFVDDAGLHGILEQLVAQYEGGRVTPWTLDSLPADFVQKLRGAIVGIEIEITRLEGKSKMSQNRSVADQRGAIEGLKEAGDPLSMAVAAIMEANLAGDQ